MFLDDKTEMAGVVPEPNEKSKEYAQSSGSIIWKDRGTDDVDWVFAKKSSDVCSFLPHCLIVEREKHDGRIGEDAAQRVLGASGSWHCRHLLCVVFW